VPTAQNLLSASRGGENREKPKRGELTLDLVSGEELAYTADPCGSWLAGDGGLTADLFPDQCTFKL
jgi:hypothetical protein